MVYSANQQPQQQTFSTMQTAGQARPPSQPATQPQTGGYNVTPNMDPRSTQSSATSVPGGVQPSTYGQNTYRASAPDLQGGWSQLQGYANVGYGAPSAQQTNYQVNGYQSPGQFNAYQGSNYQPQGYQGPGQFNAYQGSSYDPGAYQNGASQISPGGNQTLDNATLMSVMGGLANPSRYGAAEAGQAFNVLNNRLTQSGNADYQRINEDMAKRGIYASTTAGGRLGDLATNLNQQRSDYATQIAMDQAKNYQSDRMGAINQALGYGNQAFGQQLQSGQFNEGLSQGAYQNNLGRNSFLLGQNNQNFGQQANQYGLNQGEAQNQFNSGLQQANFGLGQNQQNYSQQANQFGVNQGEAQNRFNSGLQQQNFNLGQSTQNYQNQLNGFQAQQGSNQQTFNQMLQALSGQQGFQQQGFENQLATEQMNNQQQQAYMNYLLQLYGGSQ